MERYELLGSIARGGMGTVYRARDRNTGHEYALKCVIARGQAHPELATQSLQREFQVLKGLRHPRIIQVFDYGRVPDGAYYTMELLEGEDLRHAGRLDWRTTCQYLHDLATCLSLLHARRLLHRDLSPGNVKLTGDGHCKLIDFGALTSFGRTRNVIGTAPFIAPEVLRVGHLDQRVDLYALGALGYFCLTGQHAYPAKRIGDLRSAWTTPPVEPRTLVPKLPGGLSDLIMDLLRMDLLARPASAAEVITKLEAIARLQGEPLSCYSVPAQSFFATPTYVGRRHELELFEGAVEQATRDAGRTLRVTAPRGSGRTRLLDEAAVRAQLAGAAVLRADASVHVGRHGTTRALCAALLDELPRIARHYGRRYRSVIAGFDAPLSDGNHLILDDDDSVELVPDPVEQEFQSQRWGERTRPEAHSSLAPQPSDRSIDQWFVDVSRERPLVVLVDNVEYADDGSMATLLGLAKQARFHRIMLVCTEGSSEEAPTSERSGAFGLHTLRQASEEVRLEPLTLADTVALLGSVFGDSPRLERLAGWIYEETAGSPLHALGLVRDLTARGEIRHERGVWLLPSTRPDTHTAEGLEDWLLRRVQSLSGASRGLLEALCLNSTDTTVALCQALCADQPPDMLTAALEEFEEQDILYQHQSTLVFGSTALRQAVLRRMDASVRRKAHLRLGVAIERLTAEADLASRFEAGFHLIKGGNEVRGAEMIAVATHRLVPCAYLVASLHHVGESIEAALKVYRRLRRGPHERVSMLTMLSLCGYYEHYRWAERYGDEALDTLETISGLRTARRLTPWLGRPLACILGLGLAAVLYYLTPRSKRVGSFRELLSHVCGGITGLCGVAAISLDAERCARVAEVLSPVAWLPRRLSLVAIYELCCGLGMIAQEHPIEAFEKFDDLARKFDDPHYYWILPGQAAETYAVACHFARGAFAMMRADGRAALESADAMERSGLPLYTMIAAQIHRLYHFNRGELAAAEAHRERVEVHAARVGSAWQVELWEPASLLPYYLATGDVVELSRLAYRIDTYARQVPSMWRYRELSQLMVKVFENPEEVPPSRVDELCAQDPRSFIGGTTTLAECAVYFNLRGWPERAREVCDIALRSMTDHDRACTMLFLLIDVQTALVDTALGNGDAALARLDREISRHASSENPFVLGLLHEARARIALAHGHRAIYVESLEEATRWLRGTGTPALVAMADRLAGLGIPKQLLSSPTGGFDLITAQLGPGETEAQTEALCTTLATVSSKASRAPA